MLKQKLFRRYFALLLLVGIAWTANQLAFSTPTVHAQTDFSCTNVSEIPQIECEALVAIVDANPDGRFDDSWFSSDTPCSWVGVACVAGQITTLSLSEHYLTSLPPEIGTLSTLTYLSVSENQLTAIPPEIGTLSALTSLGLYGNQLTTIPPEIGDLISLSTLGLSSNKLMSLPPEIGNLTALTRLSISNNNLTTVPPEIGNLTALESLTLNDNNLTTVPPEVGNLSVLTQLSLHNNNLTIVPSELANLPHDIVSAIIRAGIQIEGYSFTCATVNEISQVDCEALVAIFDPIPAIDLEDIVSSIQWGWSCQAGALVCIWDGHVERLLLSNFMLTSVPIEISTLANLTELDLSGNSLTTVPVEIIKLANLTELDLSDNLLTTVPVEIGTLTNLRELHLYGNELTALPSEFASLPFQLAAQIVNQGIEIEGYQFCANISDIPAVECEALSAIAAANSAQQIMAEWEVTNTFCSWEAINCIDGHVTSLSLSRDGLIILPPEIGNLSSLISLSLGRNSLTRLPPEIGNLTSLRYLSVSNNEIAAVPPEIGNLTALTELSLSGNNLTSLPSELSNLSNLTQLFIEFNSLESLPAEFGNLDNLTTLIMNNNNFTRIPAQIDSLSKLETFFIEGNPLSPTALELTTEPGFENEDVTNEDIFLPFVTH